MYYATDSDGVTFEGKTLKECLDQVAQEGNYLTSTIEGALANGNVSIIKGTRIKVKVIPASYQEIVPPKVVKKPAVKPKRGK